MTSQGSAGFLRKSSGLVRQATLFDSFIFNSAASAFGFVIILFVFYVAWLPGGDLLAGIPFLLPAFSIAIVYAFLTATMPRSGGDYVFNSRILHPSLGFSFNFAFVAFQAIELAWCYWWVWTSGMGPILSIGSYITGAPSLYGLGVAVSQPWNCLILCTILNAIFAVVAMTGLKYMLRILNVIYVFSLIGMFLGIIFMASTSHSQFVTLFNNFISTTDSQLKSSPNPYQAMIDLAAKSHFVIPPRVFAPPIVAVLAGNVIWTFYSSYFAGEMKGANSIKRNLIAMVGSTTFNLVAIAVCIYFYFRTVGYDFIASYAYVGWNPGVLPTGWNPAGLTNFFFGMVAQNSTLALIIVTGWTFAQTLVYVPVLVVQVQRNLFGWSIDRLVPDKLSEVSSRYRTPLFAILAETVLVEVMMIGIFWGTVMGVSLSVFLALTIIGPAVASMLLPGFTGMVLPWRKKDLYEGSPAKIEIGRVPVICIAGAIEVVFMLFLLYEFLAWPGFGLSNPTFVGLTLGFFVAGFVLFWIIRAIRKRQGIDIDLAFREVPPV